MTRSISRFVAVVLLSISSVVVSGATRINKIRSSSEEQKKPTDAGTTTTTLGSSLRRGLGNIGPRIVNGTTVTNGEQFPWFTLLGDGVCGGTLIAPDRVLTSATCIINNPHVDSVQVNAYAKTGGSGKKIDIRCSNIHPDYYRTETGLFNDVAVIKLQEDAVSSESSDEEDPKIVKLNDDPTYPQFEEQEFVTMGFGFTDNVGPLSDTLQVAKLTLLSPFDCQERYQEMAISPTQHVCALEPGIGVCTGDSGGPLMDGDDNDSIQVGITSFTFDGCASSQYPDVFTNVATYIGWIKSQIDSDVCLGEEDTIFSVTPTSFPTRKPTTPSPTPSPTVEPTKCFFDKVAHVLLGIAPFAVDAAAAGMGVDDPPTYEGEDMPSSQNSAGGGDGEVAQQESDKGFWSLFNQIVVSPFGQKGEDQQEAEQLQEDKKEGKGNKGGGAGKTNPKKQKDGKQV